MDIMQNKDGEEYVFAIVDFAEAEDIESYAKRLEGMTFQEVLDLGISPEGVSREYNNKRYKGGMGTLIEERYFGYKANSDESADFSEAGVELKTTCYDTKKDDTISAGERLVLTMIPFNQPIEDNLRGSHLWEKSEKILLIFYKRDKSKDSYAQVIKHVMLFSPPEKDLRIIEDDYNKIRDIVQAGRAEELSEGLTNYLGACTKGASEAKMWAQQYYPPHTKAKRRAFCYKRQYMDYVLQHYVLGKRDTSDSIVKNDELLKGQTFESYVLGKIGEYKGETARSLCKLFGLKYTKNKAQWTTITYAILGARGQNAEEFEKANISVRTVRIEEKGGIKESLSLNTFEFKDIIQEEWEESNLRTYLDEARFLFAVFEKSDDDEILLGATFWNMPISDLDGPVQECWEQTKKRIQEGVVVSPIERENGKIEYSNNLPGTRENRVSHVRPHTSNRAYRFSDGTIIGDLNKDGSELPDGRWMTKQSFWLNSKYIYAIIQDSGILDLD